MRHVSNAIMEVSRSRENAHAVLLVERFDGGRFAERPDFVVQEVSIEVFLDGRPTFRGTCSPWDVEDLVVGRLFLEGAIVEMDDVVSIEVDLEGGLVDVLTRPRGRRTGDGCVIVPFGSLPGRAPAGAPVAARPLSDMQVAAATVNAAIALLERQSLLFRKTGGVHSAALADMRGRVLAWREDIGRHSALDKLVGWCVCSGERAAECMVLFSGRVPLEIVARVAALGCPLVVSPGAPTNLSIELAERSGLTLVGFAKHGRFNVYSHPERIVEWER